VLSDPARHEKMAAAARLTALSRFCASKIIPQYEKYYSQILGS